jgi:CheY-like chemotaxis protein
MEVNDKYFFNNDHLVAELSRQVAIKMGLEENRYHSEGAVGWSLGAWGATLQGTPLLTTHENPAIFIFMKKVLLVSPVGSTLVRYKHILVRDGLRIFTAATAEEGLRIHREETVDLILTELDLPDEGGDALCSHIRREQALRKVSIIVVNKNMPEEIARAKGCGANARLLIPIKPEQLKKCIGQLLNIPPRHDCRVLVKTQRYCNRGANTLFGTSRNISVSGLLIDSDDLLAVGDRISCTFFLPGPRRITAIGEVIRATRTSRIMNQYGIKFVHLYPQMQAEIEQYIASTQAA